MVHVKAVRVLEGFLLHVTFTNGERRVIDFEPYVRGPMFDPLRDPAYFREVKVDAEQGTLVWPNGADICPDVLYGTPAASR